MATAGIIENTRSWQRVINPDDTAPTTSFLSRLLKPASATRHTPESVAREDFVDLDIRSKADDLVKAVKTIVESDTLAAGGLGDPAAVTHAMLGYLYRRLTGMRTADTAVMELSDTRTQSAGLEGAEKLIAQMEAVVADTLHTNVVAPTAEMVRLAGQITLRDSAARIPGMAAELERERLDSMDAVAGRISAICDLPITSQ